MIERRVVVTGIGTINPLGNNIEEYFSNLEKGVSGAAPITHFDAEKFKTKFACEVKNYDSGLYFDRKEVRKYDLFTQYALIAATQAVAVWVTQGLPAAMNRFNAPPTADPPPS